MSEHVALEGVRFRYPGGGGFELRVGSLSIARAERVAVVGPSGSGKSTLLGLIAGILRPSEGVVRLDGRELGSMSEPERRAVRAATVGMVFQDFALLEHLSAMENILLPYRIAPGRRAGEAERGRAVELAERLGIAALLRRAPSRLSQGERQRVAVCRALVARPALVMGDEPTGNLDPESASTTVELLRAYAEEEGATLVVVTHNHGLLGRFDRSIDTGSLSTAGATA